MLITAVPEKIKRADVLDWLRSLGIVPEDITAEAHPDRLAQHRMRRARPQRRWFGLHRAGPGRRRHERLPAPQSSHPPLED